MVAIASYLNTLSLTKNTEEDSVLLRDFYGHPSASGDSLTFLCLFSAFERHCQWGDQVDFIK